MPAPAPAPPHGGDVAAAAGDGSGAPTTVPAPALVPAPAPASTSPPRKHAADADADARAATPPLSLLLLPSRHVKTIHLVRHAEGFHNVAGALDYANYKLERFLDAHLTAEGWRQAHLLRSAEAAAVRPGVVLVSPLARALETAAAVFGGPVLEGDGTTKAQPLLMRAQSAVPGVREAHPAISAARAPPFAAVELAREHLGVHPCDRRAPLSGKRAAFPGVDFDAHPSPDADELWRADARETEAEIRERALALLRLVAAGRAEGEVAVVSHSSLLRHMLAAAARDEGVRRPFANAEMRTVVLVVSP